MKEAKSVKDGEKVVRKKESKEMKRKKRNNRKRAREGKSERVNVEKNV